MNEHKPFWPRELTQRELDFLAAGGDPDLIPDDHEMDFDDERT